MNARREVDEMTSYLRQVMDYVGSTEFDHERRLASEEFFGGDGPEFESEQQLMERCAAFYGWFMFDRRDSRSEVTPVRRFVETHDDLPARVQHNLLACEDSLFSTFRVVEGRDEFAILLNLLGEEGDYYRVVARPDERLKAGDLITARLVRWDDTWCFQGEVAPWPWSTRELLAVRPAPVREGREATPVTAPVERSSAFGDHCSRRSWLRERRQRP